MIKKKVSLPAINDVKDFVNLVTLCEHDVDLISGRYAVDAKSIMGIFSLDLSKPIEINIHADNAEAFLASINKFITE